MINHNIMILDKYKIRPSLENLNSSFNHDNDNDNDNDK